MPSCLARSAFTLIEMLTTVAILIIVLGLMVSLARYVRDRSAQQLTRDLLKQLDTLMAQYVDHNTGRPPVVESLIPNEGVDSVPEEQALASVSRRNNEQFILALKTDNRRYRREPGLPTDPFEKLPITVYDLRTLRDAWGSPVVFMPRQHQLIGLAPSRAGQDQYFFFSAGPDRRYLTRDDNLYSYEGAHGE